MAKQKGLIPLSGTISGITFYNLNGQDVARAAGGGFNSEDIKNSPRMVRVRENGSEFGMVSKAKKLIRQGLYPFLMDLGDVTLHSRMMSLFQAIKVLDTVSERGQRLFQNGLATAEGRSLLMHFDITAKKASMMLPGNGEFDTTTQQYTVSDINLEILRLPKGATAMEVCLGILEVDFPANSFSFSKSATITIDGNFTDTSFTLTPESLPTGTHTRIAVLQVQYFQEVNGKLFLFKEMKEQGLEFVGVY